MPVTTTSRWDFAPVHELFESFKLQDAASAASRSPDYTLSLNRNSTAISDGQDKENEGEDTSAGGASLGNFAQLWKTLGVAPPEPSIPTFEAATRKANIEAYASDSAVPKNVRWRDQETEDGDLEDTYDDSPPTDEAALTKNQRKKRNRKARKDAEYAQLVENLTRKKDYPHESGDDTDVPQSAHRAVSPKKTAKVIQSHTQPKKVSKTYKPVDASLSADDTPRRASQPALSIRPAQVAPPRAIPAPSTPVRSVTTSHLPQSEPKSKQSLDKWPTAKPYEELKRSVIPGITYSEPRPPPKNKSIQLPSSDIASIQHQTPTRSRHEIKPLAFQNADDRHWSLLLKLLKRFPECKSSLLSPLSLSVNQPKATGIHVFVDASNILIGFQKALKHAREIPDDARVPRVYPSFHALALLLERRRPTCKRVLVGSSPRIDAYEEAIETGYETSILDRVYKAKEMTDRQRFFAQRDAAAKSGQSSGYESSDGHGRSDLQPHPTWREQGVDEIIHLKMAESLIDTDCPQIDDNTPVNARPTMVLATGDAAVAEYSSGFLKMVQRALSRGWNVEVASWSLGISSEYLNLEKKGKHRGQFRVILLDDFAEEIFPSSE